MASKTSHAVNIAAFVCSASLVGLSIAAVYLASDAYNVLTRTFPPGFYGYNLSHYIGDEKSWGVFLWYNRSSEIKTYVAAAFSLFAGLFGAFAFGLSFKGSAAPLLPRSLLVSAALTCIVAIVCAAWSGAAEVKIKHSTCWNDDNRAVPNGQYTCTIENSACNALRFTDETGSGDAESKINHSCLGFRHARFLVIPLAVISLLLTGLYATQIWLAKNKGAGDDRAEARVRTLQEED